MRRPNPRLRYGDESVKVYATTFAQGTTYLETIPIATSSTTYPAIVTWGSSGSRTEPDGGASVGDQDTASILIYADADPGVVVDQVIGCLDVAGKETITQAVAASTKRGRGAWHVTVKRVGVGDSSGGEGDPGDEQGGQGGSAGQTLTEQEAIDLLEAD